MTQPITIVDDEEHQKYLKEALELMELCPSMGTPESDRLLAIAVAVEEYEERTFWPN